MKKLLLITLFFIAASVTLFAQDYKVQNVEYLPDVLKAQLDQRTERLNSGRKCAVLQIATQNISIEDRSTFDFTPDLGSFIPEKRIENSQWVLWVSPGITYLTIHSNLGDLDIYFPDYLHDEIESLKTYRITVVGTRQVTPSLAQETEPYPPTPAPIIGLWNILSTILRKEPSNSPKGKPILCLSTLILHTDTWKSVKTIKWMKMKN